MTKKINIYNIEVTLNVRRMKVVDGTMQYRVLLWTPETTLSYRVYKPISETSYLNDNDIIEFFDDYLTDMILYKEHREPINEKNIKVYKRKYNGYKRIFGDICPIDLQDGLRLKYIKR